MGSHVWVERCPYCGFEEMIVSSYDSLYFEIACPICGYAVWTEGKIPDDSDVETAKHKLSEMNVREKQKAIELYYEDRIPLIARLKRGESF